MLRKSFSIWSAYDVDLEPEDMVLELEKRGITECELSDEHGDMLLRRGDPEKTGAAFREFALGHGVTFPQGHLFLKVRLCSEEVDSVAILTEWIRLFSAVGVKNAVLHCDGASFPEGTDDETKVLANIAKLKELAPAAERYGVRLCLENLGGPFSSAEKLLRIIEAVGSPALGICLDTGHLNLNEPGTQVHFIETAGESLHALHLADNEGKSDQHMMPFGRGHIDFAEIVKALDRMNYQDLFNYEIPGERCPMALRKAKTDYVRQITDYLFGLIGQ